MILLAVTPTGRHRRQLGEPLDQSVTPTACCFVVTADNKHIMACGYWDNSFKCFSADSGEAGILVFDISKITLWKVSWRVDFFVSRLRIKERIYFIQNIDRDNVALAWKVSGRPLLLLTVKIICVCRLRRKPRWL